MRKKIPYELYSPDLSLRENAAALGCSVASVKKYLKDRCVDRRFDSQYAKWKKVTDYAKNHPDESLQQKSKSLGMSINTIRKYEGMSEEALLESKRDKIKVSNFDIKNKNCIKSISNSQDEILLWIMKLYNDSQPFDADLTYSVGGFYKRVPQPEYKFDKFPQLEGVEILSVTDTLPVLSFGSIVYDLPFIVSNVKTESVMKDRFMCFSSPQEMFDVNIEMLERSFRLLKDNGVLVVKTMDCAYAGKQYWVSDYVIQHAVAMGFEMLDKFILSYPNRVFSKMRQQLRARKYHSYFLVFRKH